MDTLWLMFIWLLIVIALILAGLHMKDDDRPRHVREAEHVAAAAWRN